ncbi:MAG: PP0621 family protein [Halorhodospira sp.]
MLGQILLVILIILAWIGARSLLQGRLEAPDEGEEHGSHNQRRRGKRREERVEEMARCAHCGVYLPRSETLVDRRGRHYCSEAHRRLGPRDDT